MYVTARSDSQRCPMGTINNGIALTIGNWGEEHGHVVILERDVVQMLLINVALLVENFRQLRMFDEDLLGSRTAPSQGSCTTDVPRPTLAAGGCVRVALPVEWPGQQSPGTGH